MLPFQLSQWTNFSANLSSSLSTVDRTAPILLILPNHRRQRRILHKTVRACAECLETSNITCEWLCPSLGLPVSYTTVVHSQSNRVAAVHDEGATTVLTVRYLRMFEEALQYIGGRSILSVEVERLASCWLLIAFKYS